MRHSNFNMDAFVYIKCNGIEYIKKSLCKENTGGLLKSWEAKKQGKGCKVEIMRRWLSSVLQYTCNN